MKKYISIFCTIIWLCFLLTGCTKDATNVELPEIKTEMVVGCFICPQDTEIKVTITLSNPVFSDGYKNDKSQNIKDAVVTISNGILSIIIPYDESRKDYRISTSSFPILAGKTYYLSVTNVLYGTTSGRCTVPSLNITSTDISFDTSGTNKQIILNWQDIPGQINYYQTFAYQLGVYRQNTNDTVGFQASSSKSGLFNDVNRDGGTLSIKYKYYYISTPDYRTAGYDLYLLNIDEKYYQYQKSLNNADYNNPFSEPALIYSNMERGLGIFCAYQKLKIRKI